MISRTDFFKKCGALLGAGAVAATVPAKELEAEEKIPEEHLGLVGMVSDTGCALCRGHRERAYIIPKSAGISLRAEGAYIPTYDPELLAMPCDECRPQAFLEARANLPDTLVVHFVYGGIFAGATRNAVARFNGTRTLLEDE